MRSHLLRIALIGCIASFVSSCGKKPIAVPAHTVHSYQFHGKGLAPCIVWLDSASKLHVVLFQHNKGMQALQQQLLGLHRQLPNGEQLTPKAREQKRAMRHSMLWSGATPIVTAIQPGPG